MVRTCWGKGIKLGFITKVMVIIGVVRVSSWIVVYRVASLRRCVDLSRVLLYVCSRVWSLHGIIEGRKRGLDQLVKGCSLIVLLER